MAGRFTMAYFAIYQLLILLAFFSAISAPTHFFIYLFLGFAQFTFIIGFIGYVPAIQLYLLGKDPKAEYIRKIMTAAPETDEEIEKFLKKH